MKSTAFAVCVAAASLAGCASAQARRERLITEEFADCVDRVATTADLSWEERDFLFKSCRAVQVIRNGGLK